MVSVETKPILGSLEQVRLLSDHSPTCQLSLSLEEEHWERAKDLSLSITACCKPFSVSTHDNTGLPVVADNLHVVTSASEQTTDIQPTHHSTEDSDLSGLHVVTPELPVVTLSADASRSVSEPACSITYTNTNTDLHVVTSDSIGLQVVTGDVDPCYDTPLTSSLAQPELHVVTNIIPVVPAESTSRDTGSGLPLPPDGMDCTSDNTLPVVPTSPDKVNIQLQVVTSVNPVDTPLKESSPKHYDVCLDSSSTYYQVLAPDDSDFFYINHEDIVKQKSIVPFDRLSSKDIDKINLSQSSALLDYDGDTETYDLDPYVSPSQKKKKSTYRPLRKPSKQRIAAQEMISANRAKKATATATKSMANEPLQNDDSPSSWNESDNEPLLTKKKGGSKTHGLKVTTHRIQKFKHKRNYVCPGCDQSFLSVASLNHYYRTSRDPLPCKKCGKSFFTPSSLHHHKYEHQNNDVKCETCGQGFSWASQLHDNVKTHRKLKSYPYRWAYKDGRKCDSE